MHPLCNLSDDAAHGERDTGSKNMVINSMQRKDEWRDQPVSALIDEIRTYLDVFEANLPKSIDCYALSQESMIPCKVMRYRESLIWRAAELGRAALQQFEQGKLVAGIILTRALAETSAALWFLRDKVDDAIKANALGDIDTFLVRLNAGIRTDPPETKDGKEFPRPVKVKDFLNAVEKAIPNFKFNYGKLSEFVHPNHHGTVLLYSKYHRETAKIDFGQYMRVKEPTTVAGVRNLYLALQSFQVAYNNLEASMAAFIDLCEG
jgi:hypothetical protein